MAASKKSPTVARPPRPRQAEFRNAIAKAQANGFPLDTMVLRLTLRDEAELKRDRSISVEEISFANGTMRFLGVTVVSGGVTESSLDVTGA
jgi:hypothetical protein